MQGPAPARRLASAQAARMMWYFQHLMADLKCQEGAIFVSLTLAPS